MTTPLQDYLRRLGAQHYAERRGVIVALADVLAAWWAYTSRGDITGSHERVVLPGMLAATEAAQRAVVAPAEAYVAAAVGAEDDPLADMDPEAHVGQTQDGRSLESLLDLGRQRTLHLVAAGLSVDDSLASGLAVVQRAAISETQDAGRAADSVAMALQPAVGGYVRFLTLPSCPDCVVLAGKFYRWSAGFQRHPGCDCVHLPALVASDARSAMTDPEMALESGQVRGLSQADLAALEEGADLSRLVNGKRSKLRVAKDGTRRRGRRLAPESIYKIANGDRERVVDLLRQNGYLVGEPTRRDLSALRDRVETTPAPFVIPDTWEMGDTDSKGLHTNAAGEYDPERLALVHQSYYERQSAGAVTVAEPEFRLMGGGAASGKSSIIRSGDVTLPEGHVLVNADEAKEALPEYVAGLEAGSPNAAAFAHEESSDMGKTLTSDSLRAGRNTVLDGVGNGSIDNLAGKIAKARADGARRVVGDYVTVDTEEAVRRAVLRGERSGRFVPVDVIRHAHGAVSDTFREAVERGDLFDELRLFDNNGDAPRLIYSQVQGVASVLDPVAYEAFLRKGPKYAGSAV